MPGLQYEKILLNAIIGVPVEVFERHSPYSPYKLAGELANQIREYAETEQLGYYPPLDFVQQREVLPSELFTAMDQLAWMGSSAVRSELLLRLRPFFASVQIKAMQVMAYHMPQVRPGQQDVLAALTQHFTPDRVKVDLLITMINKKGKDKGLLPAYVRKTVYRNMGDSFSHFEVTHAQLL